MDRDYLAHNDRDYLAQKQKSWFVFAQNGFMFFGRNEIHIQAFAIIPPGKLMSGDSSSSTFHHFQEFSIYNYQNSGILNFQDAKSGFIISNQQKFRLSEFQKFKKWTPKVSKISKFLSFRIRRKIFSIFPGMFPVFFLI